eukprot:6211149-Pleurochrysis_carterae.AAC.6
MCRIVVAWCGHRRSATCSVNINGSRRIGTATTQKRLDHRINATNVFRTHAAAPAVARQLLQTTFAQRGHIGCSCLKLRSANWSFTRSEACFTQDLLSQEFTELMKNAIPCRLSRGAEARARRVLQTGARTRDTRPGQGRGTV